MGVGCYLSIKRALKYGPCEALVYRVKLESTSQLQTFLDLDSRVENGVDISRYPSFPNGSKLYIDSLYLNLKI